MWTGSPPFTTYQADREPNVRGLWAKCDQSGADSQRWAFGRWSRGVRSVDLLSWFIAADLTPEERAEFERRYREHVDDWRPIIPTGPTPATDRLTRPDFGAPPVRA